jgi:DNA-binding MurR/RpiR family transcriptional regulator
LPANSGPPEATDRAGAGRNATRPVTGAGVLVRVRGLLPDLAPSERRVGEAVLADPAGVAAQTITSLARACLTSETTVMRFCRQLGFPGYPELRLALAAEAAMQADEELGARVAASDIAPTDDLAQVVAKIAYADAHAVKETGDQLDVAVLERVVEALVAAGRIDLYGAGASAFVAADFQQKLHRIGRAAFAWSDPHMALSSAALLRRGDVAIGISHTGATIDTVDALAEARRQGATTVGITNFPRSPLAQTADLVLTTAARETTFRSGSMASRLAQLTVVDCMFVGVAQRTYEDTLDALARTYEAIRSRRHGTRGD